MRHATPARRRLAAASRALQPPRPPSGSARRLPATLYRAALLVALLSAARADGQGFVGETQCANPTCHGAAVDARQKPWHWARSQWLNSNVDRHSRAYHTLETPLSKQIATYMGITATASEKCLVCHAPPARNAAKSTYQVREGVTCEHCHGPAEQWLVPHKATDWPQQRAQYAAQGFYNLNDFTLRAERCAECHTEIDHEIVAGGHPPLQFEMVAYAQVMKHWDDSDEHPGFSPDPTLWALGQVVGLRHVAQEIAHRAGSENYQGLGKFHGFEDGNCYQCHHKLVVDATRQGQGHVDMLAIAMGAMMPEAKGQLTAKWNDLLGAMRGSAPATQQKANDLRDWLKPFEARVLERPATQATARAMLKQILDSGPTLGAYREFSHKRVPGSNAEQVVNVDLPWWYTTGGREQTALAIQALTPPAFNDDALRKIFPELQKLVKAIDRENQNPGDFNAALGSIKAKLY